MKAHTALPDIKNLQRMREVVARLVEQAIPDAPANHNTHHAHKQNVFNVSARPSPRPGDGDIRLMRQTPGSQKIKQAKGRQVSQAVPVDGQRAKLQRNRVNVGVNKHGGILHPSSDAALSSRFADKRYKSIPYSMGAASSPDQTGFATGYFGCRFPGRHFFIDHAGSLKLPHAAGHPGNTQTS